jgi:hypothetical protein
VFGRLGAASQVRRKVGRLVSEATEVDDLADTRSLGLARRGGRGDAVTLAEVGRVERVDEVVHDVHALEARPSARHP